MVGVNPVNNTAFQSNLYTKAVVSNDNKASSASPKAQEGKVSANTEHSNAKLVADAAPNVNKPDAEKGNASDAQKNLPNNNLAAGGKGKVVDDGRIAFANKSGNSGADSSDGVKGRSNTEDRHSEGNDKGHTLDLLKPRNTGTVYGAPTRYARRKDEDEEDNDGQRRRKKAFMPMEYKKKPLSILEGAKVGESQTQDMFVSSSVTNDRLSGIKNNKSVIEEMKEYDLGEIGCNIYDVVYANANEKEKNGIGQNMQKHLFGEIMKSLVDVDDVLTKKYRKVVREIVQGAMQAGIDAHIELKDIVKMLVSGLMAMSPHDDNPSIMAKAVQDITSEVMYGKINIGYNMKAASGYLGASLHTLQTYYKNYQKEVEYTKELEHRLSIAFSETIWTATGEISNFSQSYAKANMEQFMAGKLEEEKIYSKNYVKEMVFSPLKRVFSK